MAGAKRATTHKQTNPEPGLVLGDIVRLRRGGPNCLVVDIGLAHSKVMIAWRDLRNNAVRELSIPETYLMRVNSLW